MRGSLNMTLAIHEMHNFSKSMLDNNIDWKIMHMLSGPEFIGVVIKFKDITEEMELFLNLKYGIRLYYIGKF